MPAANQSQTFINGEISQELQAQASRVAFVSFFSTINQLCLRECANFNTQVVGQDEERCSQRCFKRRNMAVNTYIKALIHQI